MEMVLPWIVSTVRAKTFRLSVQQGASRLEGVELEAVKHDEARHGLKRFSMTRLGFGLRRLSTQHASGEDIRTILSSRLAKE